ncbi:unnamed protein product [Heterobilharzia americana]|nr:unnamed protein product [Heterobilharzia americana]
MLEFQIRSVNTLWIVSVPITKQINRWTNIGVAWGKSTQTMKIVINGKQVATKTLYQGVRYLDTNLSPTSIWIGCSKDLNGQIVTSYINPGIKVATVSLWYWPIQLNELFTGGLEYYLVTSKVVTEPPVTRLPQTNYADYTNEVEELIPAEEIAKVLNPIYEIADYYNPLLTLPTGYAINDVELTVDRSALKTAYLLKETTSCFEMKVSKVTCPSNLKFCTQGLSIGVWIKIPNDLNTTSVTLDILEIVNGVTVSVFNNYINVFVNVTKGVFVFRVYNVIPKDVWFSLGIAISNFIDPGVAVYFNGIQMSVDQVMPPTETLLIRTDKLHKSSTRKSSHASYYWTPDPYIAYDSSAQIQARQKYNYLQPRNDYSLTGIPGFSLASIFRSKYATFRSSQFDYENKSTVPVFRMKPQQYMMLGLRKSSEVIPTNLVWSGQCLHEPSLTTCNARGFSLSIWIKLLSVSNDRLRFYLNSGDGGTSLSTISYFRGVSIFTDTSLIGVSISQFSLTWQLVLDSSSYKVGEWLNIGILWRGNTGLTMLLDGVNYGSILPNGNKVYKPRESPPYIVLGRFNTDEEATWMSPSDADYESKQRGDNQAQWEMSNYALGDITYFNRLLSQKEYNQQIGLLGVPHLHGIDGYVWFGRYMITPQLSQLTEAASRNISKPGAIRNTSVPDSVRLLDNPEAVLLTGGGSLRLGTFKPNTCPFSLQACKMVI